MKENIAKRIYQLRKERNLSQQQLANAIGVTQKSIDFWEKGINEPTAGYVVKLATFFNVSADDLLSYEFEKTSEITTRGKEMNRLFSNLSVSQQEALINVAREYLKNK